METDPLVQVEHARSKSSKGTSVSDELEQEQERIVVTQKIIEVPNGQSIDGQPQQPGPQYKRGRGRSFFKDPPRKGIACQVPGCERSLHKLRDYYKRYKICPYHLELNCMVVEGQSIRFCQQCGRFQLLEEFDGDRRSCRRKLEKHNERRRKLEGALTDSDSGGEGSGGGRSRSGGHKVRRSHESGWGMHPNSNLNVSEMLQNLAHDDYLMHGIGPNLASGLRSLMSGGWAPPSAANPPPGPQLHPGLVAALAEVAAGRAGAPQTPGAIPMLTSQPVPSNAVRPAATSGTGLTANALQQLLQDGGAAPVQQIKTETMPLGTAGSAFAPLSGHSSDPPTARTNSGGQNGSWGGSPGNPQPTGGVSGAPAATFPSAAAPVAAALPVQQPPQPPAVPPVPATIQQNPPPPAAAPGTMASLTDMLNALQNRHATNSITAGTNGLTNGAPAPQYPTPAMPAVPAPQPDAPFHPSAPSFALSGGLGGPQAAAVGQLLNLLSQLERKAAPRPLPEQDVMNMSLKLFKATPAQLPPGLLHELTAWMTKTPTYAEIALRPGCVHTSTTVLVSESERSMVEQNLKGTVQRVFCSTGLGFGGEASKAVIMQIDSSEGPKAAIVLNGKVKMLLDLRQTDNEHRPPLPTPVAIWPLAATPSYQGSFVLLGQGMENGQSDRVHCRTHGVNAQVEVVSRGSAIEGGERQRQGGGWIKVAIPRLVEGGYAMEIAHGPLVSSPVAFVVVDDAAAVDEIRQLEYDTTAVSDTVSFLQKLGLVFRAGICAELHLYEDALERVGQVAQEIAAVCLLRGWSATLRRVLPITYAAAASPARALQGVGEYLGSGVTPLMAAVIKGHAPSIEVLGKWASEKGISLVNAELEAAVGGLTAFHVAAMLQDPCSVVQAMLQYVDGAAGCWGVALPPPAVSALTIAASLKQESMLQMLASAGVPAASEAMATLNKQVTPATPTKPAVTADLSESLLDIPCTSKSLDDGSIDDGASTSGFASTRSSDNAATIKREETKIQYRAHLLDAVQSKLHLYGCEDAVEPTTPLVEEDKAVTPALARVNSLKQGTQVVAGAALLPRAHHTGRAEHHRRPQNSIVLAIYHLLLTVLLPALLPERMAIGAAVLPAIAAASFVGNGDRTPALAWTMVRVALMAVLAVSLNRSATMASIRAAALNTMCENSAMRAVISTLWMWAIAGCLALGPAQHVALFLMNFLLSLLPIPSAATAATGKAAWFKMAGAACCALMITVCVPFAVSRALKVTGLQLRNGLSTNAFSSYCKSAPAH